MNSIVKDQFDVLHQTQALRHQLMDVLTDSDLAYSLPGSNHTLRDLCRIQLRYEQAYVDSFKTFKIDFSAISTPEGLDSVDALKAAFKAIDDDLNAVLSAFSQEEVDSRMIDRGGWTAPVTVNMHIYRESVLIFCGKADIYARALDKTLPQQWLDWVG